MRKFDYWQQLIPSIVFRVHIVSQHFIQHSISAFSLAIRLRMVGGFQKAFRRRLLPEGLSMIYLIMYVYIHISNDYPPLRAPGANTKTFANAVQ